MRILLKTHRSAHTSEFTATQTKPRTNQNNSIISNTTKHTPKILHYTKATYLRLGSTTYEKYTSTGSLTTTDIPFWTQKVSKFYTFKSITKLTNKLKTAAQQTQ